jgi:hypothetical protein
MNTLKTFTKLPIPHKPHYDRKTYNPYTLFDHWLYRLSNKYEFVSSIYRVWNKFIDTPIKNISYGIENLYNYFWVIWRNREWDGAFTYELLQRKIEIQRKYLINRNSFVSTEQTNRDMTLILNLLNRVQNEYYADEYFDYYDLKLDFVRTEDTHQELYTIESEYSNERYDEYLSKYPRTVKLVKSQYPELTDHDLCGRVGQHLQEKCHRILHRMLEDKLMGFWD